MCEGGQEAGGKSRSFGQRARLRVLVASMCPAADRSEPIKDRAPQCRGEVAVAAAAYRHLAEIKPDALPDAARQ